MKQLFIMLIILALVLFGCSVDKTSTEKTDETTDSLQSVILGNVRSSVIDENTELWINGPSSNLFSGSYYGNSILYVLADITMQFRQLSIDVVDELSGVGIDIHTGQTLTDKNLHLRLCGKTRITKNYMDLEMIVAIQYEENYIKSIRMYFDTYNFNLALTQSVDYTITDIKTNYWDQHDTNYSIDTLSTVFTMYSYFQAMDLNSFFAGCNPLIDWGFKGKPGYPIFVGYYSGVSGVFQYFMNLSQQYKSEYLAIDRVLVDGNRADIQLSETVNTKSDGTGISYSIKIIHSIMLDENGMLKEFKSINDSATMVPAYEATVY